MGPKLKCRLLCLCLAFTALGVCPALHAEQITVPIQVTQRVLISAVTVNQGQYDYTYAVKVVNTGAAATNVTAVVTSFTPDVTVVQGNLTFPDLPAGGTATSTNTFTIRANSGVKIDQDLIRLAFSAISTPVADAGHNQIIRGAGQLCMLNARGSYDPYGLPLTYHWWIVSKPQGSTASPELRSSWVVPQITADMLGNYELGLTVSNGYHTSAPSYVYLSSTAVPPSADAGFDQTISPGETVQVDGTHSVNPMGQALTYAWSFVSWPKGEEPMLSDPSSPMPTFVAGHKKKETYTLQLVVSADGLSSLPDTVTYTTGNTPPRADAGPDLQIQHISYGFLSANRSTDVNGDFLTYRWATLSGSPIPLGPVPNPDFQVPGTAADEIELFVSDGHSESISTLVVSSEYNMLPTFEWPKDTVLPAIAKMDAPTTPGTVELDGMPTMSSDPLQGGTWSLRRSPPGSTAKLETFNSGMNASITPDVNGLYIAQFYATTESFSSTTMFENYPTAVSFLTQGGPPVADPGGTQFGLWTAPTVHTLDGSASWDPDGHPLTYHWSMLYKPLGSNAVLSSATAVSPTFTADVNGTYIFQLIVNNSVENSVPAVVSIIPKDSADPVAYDVNVNFAWKSSCVPVSMMGNDPDLYPIWGYTSSYASLPAHGFLTNFNFASNSLNSVSSGSVPSNVTSSVTSSVTGINQFPPVDYDQLWGSSSFPADNPAGYVSESTVCYIPFSQTFTGFDSFTYELWDMGYPEGCYTPGNYCIAPKHSAPGTVTLDIFQTSD